MKIGEQVYHNPVFLVAPPDREVDSVFAALVKVDTEG